MEEVKIRCTSCREECQIIPLDNSFDYGGTHCTNGMGGTHYPSDYGRPVSDCCECEVEEFYDDDE